MNTQPERPQVDRQPPSDQPWLGFPIPLHAAMAALGFGPAQPAPAVQADQPAPSPPRHAPLALALQPPPRAEQRRPARCRSLVAWRRVPHARRSGNDSADRQLAAGKRLPRGTGLECHAGSSPQHSGRRLAGFARNHAVGRPCPQPSFAATLWLSKRNKPSRAPACCRACSNSNSPNRRWPTATPTCCSA